MLRIEQRIPKVPAWRRREEGVGGEKQQNVNRHIMSSKAKSHEDKERQPGGEAILGDQEGWGGPSAEVTVEQRPGWGEETKACEFLGCLSQPPLSVICKQ